MYSCGQQKVHMTYIEEVGHGHVTYVRKLIYMEVYYTKVLYSLLKDRPHRMAFNILLPFKLPNCSFTSR